VDLTNRIVGVMVIGIATIAMPSGADPPYRLVYNPSESAPRGWYALVPEHHPKTGQWVLVHLPQTIARLADERGYLPMHVSILKRIGARSGEEVCASVGGSSSKETSSHKHSKTIPEEGPCRSGAAVGRSSPRAFPLEFL